MLARRPVPTANDRWTCGFVDREGCFTISFQGNSNAFRIRQLVSQKGIENLPVLRGLALVFGGVGTIEKHSKTGNRTFVVSGKKNCYSQPSAPYFSTFALKTKKAAAFDKWKKIHRHIRAQDHQNPLIRPELKRAAAQINLRLKSHSTKKRAIRALEADNQL